MEELKTLRTSLMKQLENIENGEAKDKTVHQMVAVSNSVINSFNTELRDKEIKYKYRLTNEKVQEV